MRRVTPFRYGDVDLSTWSILSLDLGPTGQNADRRHHHEPSTEDPPEADAALAPDVSLICRNVVLDLGPASPLRPLALLVPSVFASCASEANDIGQHLLPAVPPWHTAPATVEGREDPDFHVYSCTCSGDGAMLPPPSSGAEAGVVTGSRGDILGYFWGSAGVLF